MKKNDMILIAILLVLAGILYLFFFGGAEAGGNIRISVDGKIEKELPLDENTTYRVEGVQGYNIVEIKDGYAHMQDGDCPDKLCVEHKRIHLTGETIVCLPHKLVVEIIGGEDREFDVVVG